MTARKFSAAASIARKIFSSAALFAPIVFFSTGALAQPVDRAHAPAPLVGDRAHGSAAARPDFSRPPALPARPRWVAPAPEVKTLPSGARVALLADPALPIVHVLVAVDAGSALDPPDRPGLAAATALMLEDGGAGARSGAELSEAFDDLGGELKIECDEAGVRIFMSVLSRNLDAALALLGELLARPRFDAAAWPGAQRRRVAEILRQRDEPAELADLIFQQTVFGDHPYGHPPLGTLAAVEKFTAAELRAFYKEHYGPRAITLTLIGDAPADAGARFDAALANWRPAITPTTTPPDAPRGPLRVVLVDRPGAPQSELRVGQVGIATGSPDFAAAAILEMVLGGSFTSRLVQNLREKHGYTYVVKAEFKTGRAAGPLVITSAVRTDATADSVREILAELDGMRAPLTGAEIDKSRALVEQKIVDALSTGPTAALVFGELALDAAPLDFWSRMPARLAALDTAALTAAWSRLFARDRLTIVIVGDRKKIEPALRKLPEAKSLEILDGKL